MGDLEQALVQLSNDGASAGAIDKAIADCGEGRTDAAVADAMAGRDAEPALADVDAINEAFGAPTVEEILTRVDGAAAAAVAAAGEDGATKHWAVVAQRLMGAASPTSLAVAHRAIEEGRQLSLGKCLEMEYLIAQRFMNGEDFFEGVGKMLNINGDRDSERNWEFGSVAEAAGTVGEYFVPGDGGDLKLPEVKR